MTTVKRRPRSRSARVVLWLAVLWAISFLGLVLPLSAGIRGAVAPISWIGFLYVVPLILIAVLYWLIEPAVHSVQQRMGRRHAR